MGQRRNISGFESEGVGGVDKYWCTADQSASSTTIVSSTYLVAPVFANATYFFRAFIIYSAGTTGKFEWSHSIPSGATFYYGDATNFFGSGTATDTWSGKGAGSKLSFGLDGYLKTTNAGNLTGRFAQSVSDTVDSVLYTGSWFKLDRVA